MKKWTIPLVLLLAGCSGDGGFNAVSDNIPKAEEKQQEVMEPVVEVHSVAGSSAGTVFKVDERSKWIVTEASVFRDHPRGLIVTSNNQQLEAPLVAVDATNNIAILEIRNSAHAEAVVQDNQTQLEDMLAGAPPNYEERYALKAAFADVQVPQQFASVLADYDKPTFDYNPDELQVFIASFNATYNEYVATGEFATLEEMLLSDLLVEAFKIAEDKRYVQSFEMRAIEKAGFEWVIQGKSESYNIIYKVNRVDGIYYVTYFMIEE